MLGIPRSLRKWVRRNTNPIEQNKAFTIRKRLSQGYLAVGIILFNLVGWRLHKYIEGDEREEQKQLSYARFYAEKHKTEDIISLRFKGTKLVEYSDLAEEKEKHGRYLTDEELKEQGLLIDSE